MGLWYRMKAKPSVRVWLSTIEMHSAESAVVQARTTGEVVRMGSRDTAWRAMSMGTRSV